ncbi:hypothetical protein L209DRAFT_260273 [Thermothelomyces heterothallicus CBS 203.75]
MFCHWLSVVLLRIFMANRAKGKNKLHIRTYMQFLETPCNAMSEPDEVPRELACREVGKKLQQQTNRAGRSIT